MENNAGAEPIAIIGIGCRFPGADGPEAFWRLLQEGVDAVGEIPPNRLAAAPDGSPALSTGLTLRRGGFLDGLDRFDAAFFDISPREAERMDPQQRLLMEVAWEALEDAGQVPARLAGSDAGVFVGMWINDYEDRLFLRPDAVDFYMTTGTGRYSASGRVSFHFGWQGPSLTVDTACSSSLVAVHLACQALWAGECSLALAGGANVILEPQIGIAYTRSGMLSPDGRCKFADASANGYVRSEGAALVALKPLARAVADGDPVYAVIRGSAVNNDGRTSGFLTTPGREGQQEVLRKAYLKAGVGPGRVQYVEAHGTGTKAGDPVELAALGAVVGVDRPSGRPCFVGSVKSNIGHTEGAAGVAGLIKAALSLKHRRIPPSLHFRQPNPEIPWSELPLQVPTRLMPWPEGEGPALAGVSAFGISGTNAHVVLQEPPVREVALRSADQPLHLLCLSARSEPALRDLSGRLARRLAERPDESLADLCFTANARRAHLDHRLALEAASIEQAAERLAAFHAGRPAEGVRAGRPESGERPLIAFLFTGQGSQYVGMGRGLFESQPVFRRALERCDELLRPHMDEPLLSVLYPQAGDGAALEQTAYAQPALFALEWALVELWRSWGIEPSALMGHSLGEYVAACAAGVFSLEDGLRLVAARGRLMQSLPPGGAMVAVAASEARVKDAVTRRGGKVSIASVNGPEDVVVSGSGDAVSEIVELLAGQGIRTTPLRVASAFHSSLMDPMLDELERVAGGIAHARPGRELISNLTGGAVGESTAWPDYWRRHARSPVRFADGMRALWDRGYRVFVEVGPRPTLLGIGRRCAGEQDAAKWLPSLREGRDDRQQMLESLGELYVGGADPDWAGLHSSGGRCVTLAGYPWQRERFWQDVEPERAGAGRRAEPAGPASGHPLLGRRVSSSVHLGTYFWDTELSSAAHPFLAEHRVNGAIVVPAAAYLEMALAAYAEAFGTTATPANVAFEKALLVPEGGAVRVQLVLSPQGTDAASFRVSSREEVDGASWTLHAKGELRAHAAAAGEGEPTALPPVGAEASLGVPISGSAHDEAMRSRGLQYGPRFRAVSQVWCRMQETRGRLVAPDDVRSEASSYQIHPALLDAAFQLLVACLPGPEAGVDPQDTFLPVALESLELKGRPRPDAPLSGHARLRSRAGATAGSFEGDVRLFDEAGGLVLEARGLRLQRLEAEAARRVDRCFFGLEWEEQARPVVAAAGEPGRWLVLAGRSEAAARLISLLQERGADCLVASPGAAYASPAPGRYQLDPDRPEHFRRLLEETGNGGRVPFRGVVHLWSLDSPAPQDGGLAGLGEARRLGSVSTLHLVQALSVAEAPAPRLWLVTSGAQQPGRRPEAVSAAQAPLWGLGRVVAGEHPELRCTCVDLGARPDEEEIRSLCAEIEGDSREDQLALRTASRFVARLVRAGAASGVAAERRRSPADGRPFRAEVTTPGVLDNLTLRAIDRVAPGPGQVEIEVHATGLNFMNVMSALGICPGYARGVGPLGLECAGRVVAVGTGVDSVEVGDEVVAVALDSLATHVVTEACLVVRMPHGISFEEAATIPIAFLTADYALNTLAGMRAGERVLIHAASGGVGLAALQLAQRAGAEVFATAGSPEKCEYLRSLGVRHVLDSRSLAFGDDVRRLTGGEGVDIVLNSLAGEAIARSLDTLRPYGRFLEIGKRDIHQNAAMGLAPFRKSLSYFANDLDRMIRERPKRVGELFVDVMRRIETGELRAIPRRDFPAGQVADAFRHMAMARHIGKIVITLDRQAPIEERTGGGSRFADGTYLVTGGLGGLGLAVAQWLAERGARHLVLAGRRAPDEAARLAVDALTRAGAHVHVARVDVADPKQVADMLAEIAERMPPLKGVVHAAGVLDDGILLQLDAKRLASVMAAKVEGAWNLHSQTAKQPLDLFVTFSSVVALLGLPGQGNYAAANAFLDSLAWLRRAEGLPAQSIAWGPWRDVGMASQGGRAEHLARRGLDGLSVADGLAALDRALRENHPYAIVMRFDEARWASGTSSSSSPLLGRLDSGRHDAGAAPGARRSSVRESLLAVEKGPRRRSLLESHLQEQVAQVLRLSASRVDPHRPLRTLGLDSLMALELRNRLETDLSLSLSATVIWNYPTVATLAPHLAERMGISLVADAPAAEAVDGDPAAEGGDELSRLIGAIESLSADEARGLLARAGNGGTRHE